MVPVTLHFRSMLGRKKERCVRGHIDGSVGCIVARSNSYLVCRRQLERNQPSTFGKRCNDDIVSPAQQASAWCLSRCITAANGGERRTAMKSIAIASLFVLVGTAAQAEIICTQHGGCRETGVKLIAVSPSHVNGQPMTSYRSGSPQQIRNLGRGEEMTDCQYCNRKRR